VFPRIHMRKGLGDRPKPLSESSGLVESDSCLEIQSHLHPIYIPSQTIRVHLCYCKIHVSRITKSVFILLGRASCSTQSVWFPSFQSSYYQSHSTPDASPFDPSIKPGDMASHSLDAKFAFVNSSSYALPKDPGVRLLIRKQAMKEAGAARRRRRNYGMHNLRQFPIFLSSESPFEPAADSTTEDATKTEGANNVGPFGSPSLLLPNWITPYPKASSGQLDIGYNNQRGPDKARPQLVEDWLPTSANSFSRSPSNDYDEVYEIIQEEEDEVRNLHVYSLSSMMTLDNRSSGTGICRSGDAGAMDSPCSLTVTG
jgi:hypothetical protein